MKARNNKAIYEILSRVKPDDYSRARRALTCKWYNGGDCMKGLPGTPCEPNGCVAWTEKEDE